MAEVLQSRLNMVRSISMRSMKGGRILTHDHTLYTSEEYEGWQNSDTGQHNTIIFYYYKISLL